METLVRCSRCLKPITLNDDAKKAAIESREHVRCSDCARVVESDPRRKPRVA